MKTVSIRDAKNRLTELAREVERGETVVVTRNGRPAFDLVPHQARKGLRLEAIDEFRKKHRIKAIVPYIADDFDEPLPEDFLLRPLPVCAFRRSRPGIPSEGGRPYRLKPAGDSDDPGHLLRRALVSTSSSGQLAGSASSL